ncbi:hypothetical protein M8J77_019070 [Diaphorina citri]|nr:hypothetical protein M8J77_019070 [Diaphorina citri]
MKVFSTVVLALCVASLNAEAPGYPASGWKPNGRLLALPSRVQEAPKPVYGPPSTFSPPTNTYGPPSTVDFAPTTDLPNTTPASAEESSEVEGSGSEGASAQQQGAPNVESGLYYVLLADGRLQRVEYVTAPLNAFETEKQTAFPGFPGFQVQPVGAANKPLKYTNQPTTTASQFQVGAFQGNQNQGFNSNQNNQAQASTNTGNTFGFNKIQVKGAKFQSANFIQPIPATAETQAPSVQAQYLLAPNPAAVSAFASFQQYQAEKAYAAQQEAQAQAQTQAQQVAPAPAAPFQGFVSNVQYKDVEPITAPVYAYQGPQNFARILK